MPWETFEKATAKTKPWTKDPDLVAFLRPFGVIRVNAACREALGDPSKIRLLWDPERRLIGLRPTKDGDCNGYKFGRAGGGAQITARAFFTQHNLGILLPDRHRIATMSRGVLTIPADEPCG